VNRIAWEMSPKTYSFRTADDPKPVAMLDYLLKYYGVRLTYASQPLLEIKQRRNNIYLPPEVCIMVGLPPQIRNDKRAMLDIRKKIF